MKTMKFTLELSIEDDADYTPRSSSDAADELFEKLSDSIEFPAWVFSVDGVDAVKLELLR